VSHSEVRRLRARVRQLEHEVEIADRLARYNDGGPARERVYRFVKHESDNFPIRRLCRVCRVSPSAYYAWSSRGQGPDEATIEEAHLANLIYDLWKKSRRRYGSPRLTAALCRRGVKVSKKRVATLMAMLGICGKSGRKKFRTTVRDRTRKPAADLVERDFSATCPDELHVGDISYIPTEEGFVFVASVLDVFSRRLVGWSIADHLRTELCLDALRAAAATRGCVRFAGTIFHSDHGCQYTSELFNKVCGDLGITQSMGSVGDSYDNALAESFWASLKRELVDDSHFATKEEARIAVFEWLVWYNRDRLHSSLDYMSPEEFEQAWSTQQAA
jgi:transposase InsO family protein